MSHVPHHPHRPRPSVAALTAALAALALVLLPAAALATTNPAPKAAIEHAERQAAGATQPDQPNKAQIEHHEAQVPVRSGRLLPCSRTCRSRSSYWVSIWGVPAMPRS